VNPVVDIEHLVCHAGGRTLLDLQRLQVRAGERLAVVGHNGAGKSTLLRCLSGFVPPTRGRVQVLGRRLDTTLSAGELRALRFEVGQVMQGLHLVQRLSALDNVLIGVLGRVRGWRGWTRVHHASDVADAEAALAAVGMLAKAGQCADRLSGGERQKVAIARMLMQRPKLILADEPTASLDPLAAAEICSLLARAAHGATLITVVHNPSLLPLLAERVVGLKQSRLVFDMPLADVNDAELARLYRPDDDGALWPTSSGTLDNPMRTTAR
jgi:phosphonate transport system ATP-binding protein